MTLEKTSSATEPTEEQRKFMAEFVDDSAGWEEASSALAAREANAEARVRELTVSLESANRIFANVNNERLDAQARVRELEAEKASTVDRLGKLDEKLERIETQARELEAERDDWRQEAADWRGSATRLREERDHYREKCLKGIPLDADSRGAVERVEELCRMAERMARTDRERQFMRNVLRALAGTSAVARWLLEDEPKAVTGQSSEAPLRQPVTTAQARKWASAIEAWALRDCTANVWSAAAALCDALGGEPTLLPDQEPPPDERAGKNVYETQPDWREERAAREAAEQGAGDDIPTSPCETCGDPVEHLVPRFCHIHEPPSAEEQDGYCYLHGGESGDANTCPTCNPTAAGRQ